MNIQQLEYIIELHKNHSFSTAAEICSVTQPTLSTMVQKLEEELDVKIFDRTNKTKITTTDIGLKIINQAQCILDEVAHLQNIAKEEKDEIAGSLRLAIIPSVSPFLLPSFLKKYADKYQQIALNISEEVTQQMVNSIRNRVVDIGICAGPLNQKDLQEIHLFFDPFLIYTTDKELLKKDFISEKEIQQVDIYLLQQEHCFHGQVLSLCKNQAGKKSFQFHSASIETLIRMVELQGGTTIIPELCLEYLTDEQKEKIRRFKDPEPVRDIVLVYHKSFSRRKAIQSLVEEVKADIPEYLKETINGKVLPIKTKL